MKIYEEGEYLNGEFNGKVKGYEFGKIIYNIRILNGQINGNYIKYNLKNGKIKSE